MPGVISTGRAPSTKRGYEGNESDECVQNKKQCIDGDCTDIKGDEMSQLLTKLESSKQQLNSTAWKSFSKRKKSLLVGQDIRSRGGLQQRLTSPTVGRGQIPQ